MSHRRVFALLIVACAVSAAIGAGTTLLLAKEGPRGPQGIQGEVGPEGEGAYEALDRVDDLELAVEDLDGRYWDVEGRIGTLELDSATSLDLRSVEADVSTICRALDLYC